MTHSSSIRRFASTSPSGPRTIMPGALGHRSEQFPAALSIYPWGYMLKAVIVDPSRTGSARMCRPATCKACSKTTWAGCGQHVAQVMAGVPRAQRCTCTPQQRAAATQGASVWSRLLGRS